jgi:gamma-glutamyltranspeptidase/glutathione hydrolase
VNRSRQIIAKTEVVADSGMVTAMHPLAAEAGVEILRAGGSAADGAVATALAIGVVEPFMSGLGGCGYAVSFDAKTERTRCYDGSAVAPREAWDEMFALADHATTSLGLYGWRATVNDASETGYRAPTVPGTLAALKKLHDDSGELPWRDLFTPAIRLAQEGFAVDEYFFVQSAASARRLSRFDETMAIYFHPDGTPLVPSFHGARPEILYQPELAKTLSAIADEGPGVFYSGHVAETMADFLGERGGELTRDDFATYEARVLEPLTVPYRDCTVACLPEASGGPTVAFALRLLDGFALDALEHDSAKRLHLVAEALRMTYADRFRFLGDAGTVPVPLSGMLADSYVDERRALIEPDGSSIDELSPGDPWRHDVGASATAHGSGDAPGQHTTHINVIDRERNMVALTATLGARFGSGVTVPGLGVVLNNGMMWYDPEPGHTASIAPGKRALHAAAPSLLFDSEGAFAAIGSPGARKIMSAVLQVLMNLVDHDMGIQQAIAAPRIHRELGHSVLLDGHLPPSLGEALRERGYEVAMVLESFMSSHFGRPSGILIDWNNNCLRGGVEPYRASAAIGY